MNRPTGRMPAATQNEAENVEQPMTIMTHPQVEVNPKAYPAGRVVLPARKTTRPVQW